MKRKYVSEGYMLLKLDSSLKYRGVDRELFEPLIIEEELNQSNDLSSTGISGMYPAGWRREAYSLFLENQEFGTEEIVFLKSIKAARAILRIIPLTFGRYEIVKCRTLSSQSTDTEAREARGSFFGYDVAYPGGDYYSAVRNGLHVNPDAKLVQKYYAHLNEYGLFAAPKQAEFFLNDFQNLVLSEAASTFIIYELQSDESE